MDFSQQHVVTKTGQQNKPFTLFEKESIQYEAPEDKPVRKPLALATLAQTTAAV